MKTCSPRGLFTNRRTNLKNFWIFPILLMLAQNSYSNTKYDFKGVVQKRKFKPLGPFGSLIHEGIQIDVVRSKVSKNIYLIFNQESGHDEIPLQIDHEVLVEKFLENGITFYRGTGPVSYTHLTLPTIYSV